MRLFLARNAFPLAVGTIAAAFLGLFFLLPVLKVLGASVLDASGKNFTLSNYITILSSRFYLNGLTNSLMIAAASAISTALIGVPFAFCLARLPIGGKPVLLALAALPLVLPSFVGAYALVLLFGRAGLVTGLLHSIGIPFDSIYGAKGIIAVYTLTLYPYVVLPVTAAFKAIDHSVEEAAQNLGSSRARMLRTVTLPLVVPSILAGALLVFIEALENFGVPFVLAEDKTILSVEAYKLFVGETTDNPASAGVLGVLLVVCTVAALLVQRRLLSRRHYATGARRSTPLLSVSPLIRRVAAAYCWIVVGAAIVPFAAVVVISLMRFSGPVLHFAVSADNFAQLFQRSYRPLGNTLLLATLAACGATADRRSHRIHRCAPPLAPVGADRRGGDLAFRGGRHRARHRPGHGLQQRRPDPDRNVAHHHSRLHGPQAAILGAFGRRDPATDRSEPGGGLDQSWRTPCLDVPAHHGSADARWHCRRLRAHLCHGGLRTERDHRAIQRSVDDHDDCHVPGAGGHQPRDCGCGRDRAHHLHAGAGRPCLSPAAATRTLDALKRDDFWMFDIAL